MLGVQNLSRRLQFRQSRIKRPCVYPLADIDRVRQEFPTVKKIREILQALDVLLGQIRV